MNKSAETSKQSIISEIASQTGCTILTRRGGQILTHGALPEQHSSFRHLQEVALKLTAQGVGANLEWDGDYATVRILD